MSQLQPHWDCSLITLPMSQWDHPEGSSSPRAASVPAGLWEPKVTQAKLLSRCGNAKPIGPIAVLSGVPIVCEQGRGCRVLLGSTNPALLLPLIDRVKLVD